MIIIVIRFHLINWFSSVNVHLKSSHIHRYSSLESMTYFGLRELLSFYIWLNFNLELYIYVKTKTKGKDFSNFVSLYHWNHLNNWDIERCFNSGAIKGYIRTTDLKQCIFSPHIMQKLKQVCALKKSIFL